MVVRDPPHHRRLRWLDPPIIPAHSKDMAAAVVVVVDVAARLVGETPEKLLQLAGWEEEEVVAAVVGVQPLQRPRYA